MSHLDISKPVKLKYPGEGEETLTYQVTNFNEETDRCYIRLISKLPSIFAHLAPEELVSIHELENID